MEIKIHLYQEHRTHELMAQISQFIANFYDIVAAFLKLQQAIDNEA